MVSSSGAPEDLHGASQEAMAKARLPLGWRDNCAGLLIPLNKCRHENFYLPWKCTDEKHGYEKCQYEDMMRRMKIAQRQLVAKAQEEEE